MAKIKHGDVFAVPLPGDLFIFGRVMLNLARCYKQRLLAPGSPLGVFQSECLVQMYRHVASSPEYAPSSVLIPGAYVWPDEIGKSWPIVAHGGVDCRMLECPECLTGYNHENGEVAFTQGEIFIPIPISRADYISLNVQYCVFPPETWGYRCLHMLGRDEVVPEEWRRGLGLAHTDLRYSPHRDRIYQYLPFDKDLPYWEKQMQLGYRLERFYAY